ncbi:hypothetical protein FB459_0736 [Yimella lutea]|uniref:Uncharacterized protein n=1 Tax=Yimella lutea TaxID=587872 RepID=A0A542EDB5_9MICO|nr:MULTISPECIES: hypothetical protein [Yimella]TQJ13323.1 hypothetical protein FB459_0736 [Yimella lutea]
MVTPVTYDVGCGAFIPIMRALGAVPTAAAINAVAHHLLDSPRCGDLPIRM